MKNCTNPNDFLCKPFIVIKLVNVLKVYSLKHVFLFLKVILNEPNHLSYLTALIPNPEDTIITPKMEKQSQDSDENYNERASSTQESSETENPFLRPPKRQKTQEHPSSSFH